MTENLERVEALFSRALEFRPEERAAFLAGACGGDSALRTRVQSLLEAHEASEGILPEVPRSGATLSQVAEKAGDRIGAYKLLEPIGEGGCGVVYMAAQEEPVRRRVALKVIKLGMDTKRVVARFEAERQALALMDHPNIARVLDAGTTQTGRPFFVMELVRGIRITDYCAQHHLGTKERLELVMQVCRAIQHAHQKGIVHRDIKPSNVLVTVHDGVPVPKVIDFGIAKASEGRLTEQTLFTSFEQFIGTPAYMSPEQAQLNGLDVDTRTDVYALGVLLYELLTGTTPFDAQALLAAGLDEMRRTIREKEPLRPSTRLTVELSRAKADAGEHSEADRITTSWLQQGKQLIRLLRGDLDWIVMKCLEKDRTRRYETANGLAMDLQRHLNGEPVVARPPSQWYRFQKLVRRNQLVFATAAAVACALVLGTVASTGEAIRARRAERAQARLRQEAERARAGEASQRAAAEQHLYGALLGEARARLLTRRAGQRFESLEAITRAAALRRSADLSDAAIAALALPDLRAGRNWQFAAHWIAGNVCFDESLELCAYRNLDGIHVRRIRDDRELCWLPVPDVKDPANGLVLRQFDPQSHYLAATCLLNNTNLRCRVWDLARHGVLALDVATSGASDFSPNGRALANVNPDGTVSVKELASGRDLGHFPGAGKFTLLRFSPDGTRLAGLELGHSAAPIWDWATGRVACTLRCSGQLSFLAWNHDGSQLASGRLDGLVELWDAVTGRRLETMEGHETRVTALAFSHQGDLLASGSWDSTLRLWDPAVGQPLLVYSSQDSQLHFSPDDRTLACGVEGDSCVLLEVAHRTGYRRLAGGPAVSRPWTVDFAPDTRLLAVATGNGICFWDLLAGNCLGRLPTAECRSAHFQTTGGPGIIGSTAAGLLRWPLEVESTARGTLLRAGPPQALVAHQLFRYSVLSPDGTKILASREVNQDPLLMEAANPTNVVALHGHRGVQFVALDPLNRWAATGTWKGLGVKVYEAGTGKLLRTLPVKGTALVAFSPDGNWLATSEMMQLRLWNTRSWEPAPQTVPGDQVSEINPLAFSPDSRLLAVVRANEVQLVKVPTFEPVARLQTPAIAHIGCVSFTPDGTTLAAIEWSGLVDLWDLRILREELTKLKLDWDHPPFAVADELAPVQPTLRELDPDPFSRAELARIIPARDAKAPANLIDLTAYYNAPLTESWHSPKAAHNDLSELRQGVQEFGGVAFDIRGLIQIGAPAGNGLAYPSHVLDIPVGRQCRRLYFLHAAILASSARPGDELGSYVFHYADGRQVELPIIADKTMADWWSQPNEPDLSALIVWSGGNPAARRNGHAIRLFKTDWENPYPNVAIKEFDFTSDKPTPGQPFLVAVTAEP